MAARADADEYRIDEMQKRINVFVKPLEARFGPRLLAFLSLWFAFLCAGCCQSFDDKTKKADDAARAWLHASLDSAGWVQVSAWAEVKDSNMPQAEVILQNKSFAPLIEFEASSLTRTPLAGVTGKTLYLLRAVAPADGKFGLEVYQRPSGDVWVGGGVISRCPVPMRRRAVVAWLDKAPSQVDVTFVVGK